MVLPDIVKVSWRNVGSVYVSVCALEANPLDLWTCKLAHRLLSNISRTSLKFKVIGQRSSSPRSKNVKIPLFSLVSENMVQCQGHKGQYHEVKVKCHRSTSNVTEVKVKGCKSRSQGQDPSCLGSFPPLPPPHRLGGGLTCGRFHCNNALKRQPN